MHGGTNPGGPPAPLGNKRALRTHSVEHIAYDTLTDIECEYWKEIATDPPTQLIGELKIAEIREYRMMHRISQMTGIDWLEIQRTHRVGQEAKGFVDWNEDLSESNLAAVLRLEEALNKAQATKDRIIRRLMQSVNTSDMGAIDELIDILSVTRERRIVGREDINENQDSE
jgi:uncharacterized protein YjcR